MYADDLVIFTNQADLKALYTDLGKALETVNLNLNTINLEISVPKTQFCIFSQIKFRYFTRLIREQKLVLSLGNHLIDLLPVAKFLGVMFDSNLNWTRHIQELKVHVKKRINILRAIADISWGAHPRTLLIAYKALIRSSFDWGAQLMCDLDGSLERALTTLQCSALRIVLGLMGTTPLNVIIHMAGKLVYAIVESISLVST